MKGIRKVIQALLGISDEDMPEGKNDTLEGFSNEQLTEASSLANESFKTARDAKDVTAAQTAVETYEAITVETTARATAAADLETTLAELEGRIVVPEPVVEPVEPEVIEPAVVEPVTPEAVVEPEVVAPVAEVVPIAAAAPAPAPTPAPVVAAVPAPTKPKVPAPSAPPAPTASPVTLTASGDVKDHSAGQSLKVTDLGPAFVAKSEAARKAGITSRLNIAEMGVSFDSDRSLSDRDNADVNTAKINAVIEQTQRETAARLKTMVATGDIAELDVLTAEGGLCAPVNVRYEIFELGTDRRPLRDGLTRFGATRFGIRFNAPPVLSDVDGSVNIYSEAEDAEGTEYPKGCIRVDCGEDIEVAVAAIPLCMEVGNFQRLSFPENFAAWWRLGKVAHARTAEDFLWDQMSTLSILVTVGQHFGATRDVLAGIARASEQYRDRFRIDPETPLRAFVPSWLVTMMQVDLLRQQPGDGTIVVARSAIARFFAAFNVATTFVLDGQPAGGDSGYIQLAGGLNPWPDNADIILAAEGTFLHLDAGSLDFGTEIRDFTQIRNNDSGAFMETFEEVARVGPQALKVRFNDVCPNGASSLPLTGAGICAPGS